MQPLTRPVTRKMTSLKVSVFASAYTCVHGQIISVVTPQYQKPDCSKHIDESKGSIRNFFGRKKVSATAETKGSIKTELHAKAEPAKKIKVYP